MTIPVKKLRKNAILPLHGSAKAAGYDLYACLDRNEFGDLGIEIWSGQTKKVPTGIAVAIPDGYFGAIFARSGLATKEGLRPANCVGVIDSDYRGEIIVALHNDSETYKIVHNGDRIAQLVIMPYLSVRFAECDDLEKTSRGDGGFGSTGYGVPEGQMTMEELLGTGRIAPANDA